MRGLYCTTTSGSVVALSQAMEECHGAEEGTALICMLCTHYLIYNIINFDKAPTVGPEAGVEGVSVPVEAVGEMSDSSQPQTVSV